MAVNLPKWAKELVRLRTESQPTSSEWAERDEGYFSRVVHVAYPNGVHYVIEKLSEGNWHEVGGQFWVPELAISAAQKRAYFEDVPYRVREVVWDG